MIHLVTGGARSGKSTYAERVVASFGDAIGYIATAIAFDAGMSARIVKHRAQRPANWQTFERYHAIDRLIAETHAHHDAYLLDCVTLWISNLLLEQRIDFDAVDEATLDALEAAIISDVDQLLDAIDAYEVNMVLVTNEIGYGIVPENRMARYFRDVAGRINQRIANRADVVTLLVCGQPIEVKR